MVSSCFAMVKLWSGLWFVYGQVCGVSSPASYPGKAWEGPGKACDLGPGTWDGLGTFGDVYVKQTDQVNEDAPYILNHTLWRWMRGQIASTSTQCLDRVEVDARCIHFHTVLGPSD